MRKMILAAVATFALAGVAACGESAADKTAETKADALEAQAAATPNEQTEKNLNAQADHIEQNAGNADGGMTTANTPSTSPTAGETAGH
ncbi:MAG TPA: hypothetical protein VF633_04420 [Brevundimonas sp.]|jgi:basic membrane lipoprotein Med (substrate-binding protein (PBP1-ABC) superfamily)